MELGEHGVEAFSEFRGSLGEVLQLEKMKILNYLEQWGVLPAGNKIIK